MSKIYLWEGLLLTGSKEYGLAYEQSPKTIYESLLKYGFFKIEIKRLPEKQYDTQLSSNIILEILNSWLMLLESGISLKDSFSLLVHEQKSLLQQFIFCHLRQKLNQGEPLANSFSSLKPMFPNFFTAMIKVSENSGQLIKGLKLLKSYYQRQEQTKAELEQVTRYPRMVLIISLLLTLGIVLFIIPMFENIYAIYADKLPVLTKVLVFLSTLLRTRGWLLSAILALLTIWLFLPKVRNWHPAIFFSRMWREWIEVKDDPLIFAQSLHMLLEHGISVKEATSLAANCLSAKSIKHGQKIVEALQSGSSFSNAFFEATWFPEIFHKFIYSAEKAGSLSTGFKQIYLLLTKRRKEQFNRWSKYIEPVMMLLLGSLILILLLGIYLPIFDLGNQIR